jgi:ABC-2 type transport system permease protein
MAMIAWRALPIASLTVRQFVGGKAVRVFVVLSAIPVLFALIYAINPDVDTPRDFVIRVIFRGMYLGTLLPITVLILATGALGNEIEDRTLPFLTLKPVTRLRIVIEKLLGTIAVCTPIAFATLTIVHLLAFRDAWRDQIEVLWAVWGASFAGIVAYSAIFQLVSLMISRALLAGIVYSLVWESLLGRYVPGIRYVSIRHYTNSVFVQMLDDRRHQLADALGLTAAVVTVAVASLLCILLATWRLRRMNLE